MGGIAQQGTPRHQGRRQRGDPGEAGRQRQVVHEVWVFVFEELNLSESLADQLAPPPNQEPPDSTLIDTLLILHRENPAHRKTRPLERYLDYCPELNGTSLYRLLRGIMESPSLQRSVAMSCQVPALKYAVRMNIAERHPVHWQTMKPLLDAALQWCWEDLAARGVTQAAFLAGYGKLLEMLVDAKDLKAILECGEKYDEVAGVVKRIVEASATGRSIFKTAWLGASRSLFVEQVRLQLDALEHCDFELSEIESLTSLMVKGADALAAMGHKVYKKCGGIVQFLSQGISVTMESANDEWEIRLACRAKPLALSSGQLEPLPLERIIMDMGGGGERPQVHPHPRGVVGGYPGRPQRRHAVLEREGSRHAPSDDDAHQSQIGRLESIVRMRG